MNFKADLMIIFSNNFYHPISTSLSFEISPKFQTFFGSFFRYPTEKSPSSKKTASFFKIKILESNWERRQEAAQRIVEMAHSRSINLDYQIKCAKLMTADSNFEIRRLGQSSPKFLENFKKKIEKMNISKFF